MNDTARECAQEVKLQVLRLEDSLCESHDITTCQTTNE